MTSRWTALGLALLIGLPTGLGVYMAALKTSGDLAVSIAMGAVTAVGLGLLVLLMALRGAPEPDIAAGVLPNEDTEEGVSDEETSGESGSASEEAATGE